MRSANARYVSLLLPMRTVLLVAAAAGVIAAFRAIGDTFLIVFIGVFLALVFEYPVRLVIAKTGMSRGLASTVTVLGTAVAVVVVALLFLVPLVGGVRDFLQELPQTVEQLRQSDELSGWFGNSGSAENVQSGADTVSSLVPDAISAVLGIAGGFFSVFLASFTIIFICLFLLTDVANLKQALSSVLMPGEDERWLGVWERVTTAISRWAVGVVIIATIAGTTQGVTAWLLGSSYALGLAVIAGLLDMIPEHRRDDRRVHPRPGTLGRGGDHRGDHHARRAARLPASRKQHPDTKDPGRSRQTLRRSSSSWRSHCSGPCLGFSAHSRPSHSPRRYKSSSKN